MKTTKYFFKIASFVSVFALSLLLNFSCENESTSTSYNAPPVATSPKTAAYTVKHYKENAENSGYTLVTGDTETFTGDVGSKTQAKAKTYENFSAQDFQQSTIKENGSTVIEIKYKRKIFTITLDAGNGTFSNGSKTKTVSGKYEAPITAAEEPAVTDGKTFINWKDADGNLGLPEKFLKNETFTAYYSYKYMVEHYKQNAENDEYTLAETERLGGEAGTTTNAQEKIYEHFTAKTFNQEAIKTDGTTVIKIYYDRDIITLTLDANGGAFSDGTTIKTVTGKYDALLTATEEPVVVNGKNFINWKDAGGNLGLPEKFLKDETFTAFYYTYKVEHYKQNIDDDDYTLEEDEIFDEDAGKITTATAKTYIGFTPKTFNQETINTDGRTVIKIYYDRNIYTLTFNVSGGTFSDGSATKTVSGKYEAPVTAPELEEKRGYAISNFSEVPETIPLGNKTFSAEYTLATYTITYNEFSSLAKYKENYTIPTTFTINDDISLPTNDDVTIYGKTLKGWYTDENLTESINSGWNAGEIAENITIYGKWRDGIECDSKNIGAKLAILPKNTSETSYKLYYSSPVSQYNSPLKTYLQRSSFYFSLVFENVTITSIVDHAFQDCISLTSIIIPNGVTSIGVGMFYSCTSLTSVTIPDSVTSISSSAFRDCISLTSITIPNSVTSIAEQAFQDCTSLTSITIPNSVTSLGNYTFKNCTSLTNITIPNKVTSIGIYTFQNCYSLTNITIPNSVTSIKGEAFSACTSLANITIPDSVTSIGSRAFQYCNSLTSVSIPSSVTSIGEYIFFSCASLTSVTIPDSITSIGNSAFLDCKSLANITIPDSVTSIGERAFRNCSSLASVTIPDSVTSIGEYAFSGCKSLTSVTIPDGVTSINSNTFVSCSSLTSVSIPDSVTSIEEGAFGLCSNLASITIPSSVTSIGGGAFSTCTSLTSITIPDSVTSIGNWAFERCSSLTSITIPDSVTSIKEGAFERCSSLTSITIPSSVTSIGQNSFYNSGLVSATLVNPNGWYDKNGTLIENMNNPSSAAAYLKQKDASYERRN